jgi:hypothetical protein
MAATPTRFVSGQAMFALAGRRDGGPDPGPIPGQRVRSKDLEKAMSVSTSTLRGVNEHVKDRLWDNPYLALRTIAWDYRDGVLTLSGRLPTYYLKQVAQSAVAHVAGIERVVNRIEVVSEPRQPVAAGL